KGRMARRTRGRGASPQRVVTERATRPDGLSALAHRVACLFGLACVARAGQPTEGRQPAEGSPQGDAKHRQHAAGIAPPSRLGQAKNPAATRHFVIFSQVLMGLSQQTPSSKLSSVEHQFLCFLIFTRELVEPKASFSSVKRILPTTTSIQYTPERQMESGRPPTSDKARAR